MNQLYPIIRRVRRPLVRPASVTAAPVVATTPLADTASQIAASEPDKNPSTQDGQDARAPHDGDAASLY
jgi:hypothetical protein